MLAHFLVQRKLNNLDKGLRQAFARSGEGEARFFFPTYPGIEQIVNNFINRYEALKDENQHLFELLEQTPAGLVIVRKDGRVNYWNKAASKMFEVTAKQIKNKPLSAFSSTFEIGKKIADSLKGRQISKEFTVQQPKERMIRARVKPLEKNGEIEGAIAVLEDVTKIRRLEKARRELISNFSHELRTPIATLKASVEALLHWGAAGDPEEQKNFLLNISNEVEYLNLLVDKMLQLARLESGVLGIRKKKLLAQSLLTAALERIEVSAKAKEIEVEKDFPHQKLWVKADADLIVQALFNLLDNAVKYTPNQEKIRVTLQEKGAEVIFTVTDSGIGIPKKELPRIFERFYRVEKGRTRGQGVGLGLSLVKHIVENHNGRVEAISSLNRGSTFSIILPKAT